MLHKIIDKLNVKNFSGLISLGAGESLTSPILGELIASVLAINNKVRLRILTNGKLLTSSLPDYYFDDRIIWGITFDGFSNKDLDNLQFGIDVEKVKRNVIEICQKYNGNRLYINYTLHDANKENLINFINFGIINGIPEIYVTELKIITELKDRLWQYKLKLKDELTIEIIDKVNKILQSSRLQRYNFNTLEDEFLQECWKKNNVSPIIDIDGEVAFCCGREDFSIGSVLEDDIENKWSNFRSILVKSRNPGNWCNLCHGKATTDGTYNMPKLKYKLNF